MCIFLAGRARLRPSGKLRGRADAPKGALQHEIGMNLGQKKIDFKLSGCPCMWLGGGAPPGATLPPGAGDVRRRFFPAAAFRGRLAAGDSLLDSGFGRVL